LQNNFLLTVEEFNILCFGHRFSVFLAEVDESDTRDILQDGTDLDEAGHPTGG